MCALSVVALIHVLGAEPELGKAVEQAFERGFTRIRLSWVYFQRTGTRFHPLGDCHCAGDKVLSWEGGERSSKLTHELRKTFFRVCSSGGLIKLLDEFGQRSWLCFRVLVVATHRRAGNCQYGESLVISELFQ